MRPQAEPGGGARYRPSEVEPWGRKVLGRASWGHGEGMAIPYNNTAKPLLKKMAGQLVVLLFYTFNNKKG